MPIPEGFQRADLIPSRVTPFVSDPEPDAEQPTPETQPNKIRVNIVSPTLLMGGAENMARLLADGLRCEGYMVGLFDASADEYVELGSCTPGCFLPDCDVTIWWGRVFQDKPPGSIYVVHSPGGAVPGDLEHCAEQGLIDHVVAVSQETKEMAEALGLPATRIWNGVEEGSRRWSSASRSRPEDTFVIGSIGRYAPEKGLIRMVEALALLPDNVRLQFYGAGPVKDAILEAARQLGVDHRVDLGGVVQDVSRAMMGFDCLLNASDFEGFPLVAAEAALCSVPLVHTGTGDLDHVFMDGHRGLQVRPEPHSIAAGIMRLAERPGLGPDLCEAAHDFALRHLTVTTMTQRYAAVIEDVARDLTSQVTAFLITSGEPSTDRCREALEAQTVKVRIEEISGVSPMHRAFQQMIDRCETPYYIQVDADMILQPGAIKALYDGIEEVGNDCAQFAGYLWGDVEEESLQGVKIYRHGVTVDHPYQDSVSCEWGHNEALREAGYYTVAQSPRPKTQEECFGVHEVLQSDDIAFRRGKRLMEKYRRSPGDMAFFAGLPRRIKKRIRLHPSRPLLAFWNGLIAGLTGPMPEDTEMDTSILDPDIRRLNWLLGRASAGPQELTLCLTSRCNHRCSFCRTTISGESDVPDVTPELVTRILAAHPTVTSVCLAGFGEPMMSPHLHDLMQVLGDHGCTIGMVTNGSLLPEGKGGIHSLLKGWGLSYVNVSLNAATREQHEEITGARTWPKVINGIKASVAAGLPTFLSMVATRNTLHRIPAFIALANDLVVEGVHIHNLLPHGDHDDPEFLNQVITTDSHEALADLEQYKGLSGADIVRTWPVPIDLNPDNCPRLCQSPFVSVGIDGNGHSTPCRRVLPPSPELGGLHRHTWINRDFAVYRGAMLGDFPLPPECTRCFGAWSQ